MDNFVGELAIWGPDGTGGPVGVADAEAYCAALTKAHYENFPVDSLLLPRRHRRHFRNVYAYCRWADDLADESDDPERALALLAWWRSLLDDCYERPDPPTTHPVFAALHGTIRECGIPREPFDDLISAFEQDQTIREYETFDQLRDYCRRSADPVGRLVLYVVGETRPEHLAWSDSICTGLQLANFWQDVARDSEIGRIYLPEEDRRRFGYSKDDFGAKRENEAFLELMRFEVERAREFLVGGLPLADVLPGRLGGVIDLFARGGLRILERIEAIGYGVWSVRPVVTKWDGLRLAAAATSRWAWRSLRRGFGIRPTPNPPDEARMVLGERKECS